MQRHYWECNNCNEREEFHHISGVSQPLPTDWFHVTMRAKYSNVEAIYCSLQCLMQHTPSMTDWLDRTTMTGKLWNETP